MTRRARTDAVRTTLVAGALLAFAAGCGGAEGVPSASPEHASGPHEEPFEELPPFFEHVNGASGEWYFCEIVGAGVALLDYDGDGDLDLFAAQGGPLGPQARRPAPTDAEPPRGRLWRNDPATSADGSRCPVFTDVTDASRIDARGYGMGVAAADYDGDGHVDLFLSQFGPDQLLRNRGDGTFEDVTARAGVNDDRWNTSAAFADFDRDGRLDLYVCAYEDFSIGTNKPCYSTSGARDYCGPKSYRPIADRLYRNQGDGTFADVSVASGIAALEGPALGVICADLDGDGWTDVFVANDGQENHLWMNRGDGTFREEAVKRGCAVNEMGQTCAGMGTDAADLDDDGALDIVVANLTTEANTLYMADRRGGFRDLAARGGIAAPSRAVTGFGIAFLDYDNDSVLDLVVANGAVRMSDGVQSAGGAGSLGQRNQLFRGLGGARFEEVTSRCGVPFARAEASRGLAVGDLDDDGDSDVVVTNNGGPMRVLVNRVGTRGRWMGLSVEEPAGAAGHRAALGALVELTLASGRVLRRRAHADGSYCSSSDPRVLLGIPRDDPPASLRVRWPGAAVESFPLPREGTYTRIVRGTGVAETSPAGR